MKRLKTGLLGLAAAALLTGCSGSSTLIKSYTDTTLNSKQVIIDTLTDSGCDFFSTNLVVFPKNTTTVTTGETKEEASETTEENSETNSETTEEDFETTNTTAAAEDDEDIDAKTGLLAGIDTLTDIYGKNIYDRVYPASVTKIMTALITLEHANFNDTVVFTEDMMVYDDGAKLCGFEVGDVLTVEQLFQGLLIYSGNDAANALAVHIAGSIDAFADMMNKEAKNLGCVDTHFVNPSGLHDNDHYTSAYDLYLIFNRCLDFDTFQSTIRQTSVDISYKDAYGETVDATFTTTNQYFLDTYDYPESVRVIGGKTGTTDEAGSCLILYDTDTKNQGYISVILGASDSEELYSEMNLLLNKIPK
jgi:D-alanyl-D-alanine carboxypeptidase (penicillin-binding protein 5/6)